jgi:hypothetical protein
VTTSVNWIALLGAVLMVVGIVAVVYFWKGD